MSATREEAIAERAVGRLTLENAALREHLQADSARLDSLYRRADDLQRQLDAARRQIAKAERLALAVGEVGLAPEPAPALPYPGDMLADVTLLSPVTDSAEKVKAFERLRNFARKFYGSAKPTEPTAEEEEGDVDQLHGEDGR